MCRSLMKMTRRPEIELDLQPSPASVCLGVRYSKLYYELPP